MTKDEALDLALEALEGIHPGNMTPMAEEYWNKAITAIKQALAAPVQEPVAKYIGECPWGSLVQLYDDVKKGTDFYTTPPAAQPAPVAWDRPIIYTPPHMAPPAAQRQWVGLTDEQIGKAWAVADGEHNASASVKRRITRAIEAAHGITEKGHQ